jgi:hypothetical protein
MAQQKPYTDKAMQDHAHTYLGFKSMMKWAILLIAIIVVSLAIFAV